MSTIYRFGADFRRKAFLFSDFTTTQRVLARRLSVLSLFYLAKLFIVTLRASQRWVDMGSGEGIAIEEYVSLKKDDLESERFAHFMKDEPVKRAAFKTIASKPQSERAHVLGITYQMNRKDPPDFEGKVRHLAGRFFEPIPDREIGKSSLITDVYGVLAYSPHFDVVLQRYLELLEDGGVIYVAVGNQFRHNKVLTRGGTEITLAEWLQQILGIEVSVLASWTGRDNVFGPTYRIVKSEGKTAQIPKLELISQNKASPPDRRFKEVTK